MTGFSPEIFSIVVLFSKFTVSDMQRQGVGQIPFFSVLIFGDSVFSIVIFGNLLLYYQKQCVFNVND